MKVVAGNTNKLLEKLVLHVLVCIYTKADLSNLNLLRIFPLFCAKR